MSFGVHMAGMHHLPTKSASVLFSLAWDYLTGDNSFINIITNLDTGTVRRDLETK
jgi:hypothetical protein